MNFLADYLLYNSGNEAHEHYHQWCAFSALAAAISRRVWVEMSYFRIYPNFYICLLGPPSSKKNTALNVAKELVRSLEDAPLSGDCQSKEQLVKEMATQHVRTHQIPGALPYIYTPLNIYVTELSQFIGIDPIRMIDFLTTVFDVNWYEHRTLRHDVLRLEGPYINLLSATVPDWITTYLRADVIAGGFSRRCVFVLEDQLQRRIAFPCITEEMRSAWLRCVEHVRSLREVYGPFTWTPEARSWFEHWYTTYKISDNPVVKPFDSSKFIYVLKVGMMLSLCKSLDLRLEEEHLQLALAMVDKVVLRLPQVFSGMGRNELAQVSNKVEAYLRREGVPVSERQMRALMWSECNDSEWIQVLSHLTSAGKVRHVEDQKKVRWLMLSDLCKEKEKTDGTT